MLVLVLALVGEFKKILMSVLTLLPQWRMLEQGHYQLTLQDHCSWLVLAIPMYIYGSLAWTELLLRMECFLLQMSLHPMPLPLYLLCSLTIVVTGLRLLHQMVLCPHGNLKLEEGVTFIQLNLLSALTTIHRMLLMLLLVVL
nr:hypothetical protein Iba_scaffold18403CG1120 [Ipomoea batatas]